MITDNLKHRNIRINNKVLIELEKASNGFIDKSKIDNVFELNKQLEKKIN